MIDLSQPIRAIQEKYGLYWHKSEDATREAAALWGAEVGVHCKPTGSFYAVELLPLARIDKYANAQVKLVHAPNNTWAASTEFRCHYRGEYGPVQVWNRLAFASRDEAIKHAAEALYAVLRPMCTEPCATEASRTAASKLCEQLEVHRCGQLALF